MKPWTILAGALLLAGPAAAAETCTAEQSQKAETSLGSLDDWMQLLAAFETYAACDDGTVAEGYSDTVAKLLSERWDSVGELAALARENPAFGRFVVNHVDVTMNLGQAQAITKNLAHCPSKARDICRQIGTRLKDMD